MPGVQGGGAGVKGIPSTCSCGMRLEPGQKCSRCEASSYQAARCITCGAAIEGVGVLCDRCSRKRDEKSRARYRAAYGDPDYRRNRLERYRMVGGRCETCGIPLKGELHPDGVPWESDHAIELSEGGTNAVGNLRVRCLPHHRAKTAATKRARKRRQQGR